MKQYKIITLILMLLTSGNMLAEELDTLKVVDVEEILVIAAPKENRKLRERPQPSPCSHNRICRQPKSTPSRT